MQNLKIVGDGKLKNEILELVKKENIDDIEFVGRVPNSKIGEILNTADIFINSSNKDKYAIIFIRSFSLWITCYLVLMLEVSQIILLMR